MRKITVADINTGAYKGEMLRLYTCDQCKQLCELSASDGRTCIESTMAKGGAWIYCASCSVARVLQGKR